MLAASSGIWKDLRIYYKEKSKLIKDVFKEYSCSGVEKMS